MERGPRIMRIGIVGQGYVGCAVREVMESYYEVNTFDLELHKCNCDSIGELVGKSDVIFVCVPTPMKKDGSCDISIVESVVKEIDYEIGSCIGCEQTMIAIKSTIPPGTTNELNEKYKHPRGIVFNPEFLTEANFVDDFKNQNRIIIGGPRPATTILRQVYSLVFPNIPIIKTGSKTAEMVKYFTNTFLATKVSFANEMKMICDKIDIDYDKVVEYSTYDERLGKSHWAVPGPDNKFGFGGSCFPKDLNAIIDLCYQLQIPAKTLFGVWETNLNVRPERDWEQLKGRAVTIEENDDV